LTGAILALTSLTAAAPSRSEADAFTRKVARIQRNGEGPSATVPLRTTITESELNSWLAYADPGVLPGGLSNPSVTILGGDRVRGAALVGVEALGGGRQPSTGDSFGLLGARLNVVVTGAVHAKGGRGRFELHTASLSGLPVPAALIQELVSYFSRTPDNPAGVRLTDTFELPVHIREIELARGHAVVVQ
jgi:hypothetical protein